MGFNRINYNALLITLIIVTSTGYKTFANKALPLVKPSCAAQQWLPVLSSPKAAWDLQAAIGEDRGIPSRAAGLGAPRWSADGSSSSRTEPLTQVGERGAGSGAACRKVARDLRHSCTISFRICSESPGKYLHVSVM